MNGELEICPAAGYVVTVLANMDPPAAGRISQFITNRLPVNRPAAGARTLRPYLGKRADSGAQPSAVPRYWRGEVGDRRDQCCRSGEHQRPHESPSQDQQSTNDRAA